MDILLSSWPELVRPLAALARVRDAVARGLGLHLLAAFLAWVQPLAFPLLLVALCASGFWLSFFYGPSRLMALHPLTAPHAPPPGADWWYGAWLALWFLFLPFLLWRSASLRLPVLAACAWAALVLVALGLAASVLLARYVLDVDWLDPVLAERIGAYWRSGRSLSWSVPGVLSVGVGVSLVGFAAALRRPAPALRLLTFGVRTVALRLLVLLPLLVLAVLVLWVADVGVDRAYRAVESSYGALTSSVRAGALALDDRASSAPPWVWLVLGAAICWLAVVAFGLLMRVLSQRAAQLSASFARVRLGLPFVEYSGDGISRVVYPSGSGDRVSEALQAQRHAAQAMAQRLEDEQDALRADMERLEARERFLRAARAQSADRAPEVEDVATVHHVDDLPPGGGADPGDDDPGVGDSDPASGDSRSSTPPSEPADGASTDPADPTSAVDSDPVAAGAGEAALPEEPEPDPAAVEAARLRAEADARFREQQEARERLALEAEDYLAASAEQASARLKDDLLVRDATKIDADCEPLAAGDAEDEDFEAEMFDHVMVERMLSESEEVPVADGDVEENTALLEPTDPYADVSTAEGQAFIRQGLEASRRQRIDDIMSNLEKSELAERLSEATDPSFVADERDADLVTDAAQRELAGAPDAVADASGNAPLPPSAVSSTDPTPPAEDSSPVEDAAPDDDASSSGASSDLAPSEPPNASAPPPSPPVDPATSPPAASVQAPLPPPEPLPAPVVRAPLEPYEGQALPVPDWSQARPLGDRESLTYWDFRAGDYIFLQSAPAPLAGATSSIAVLARAASRYDLGSILQATEAQRGTFPNLLALVRAGLLLPGTHEQVARRLANDLRQRRSVSRAILDQLSHKLMASDDPMMRRAGALSSTFVTALQS